ncbi:MAG TPA: hypothetical protein ENI85_18895 [Deltaproteobacteria bacterium]|nr:hypothetical protein [Deltaproteobacteria bacterium]
MDSPEIDHIARALSRTSTWPGEADETTPVEWIQTHISHVFLVGDRVYKLRKAVRLPFLDFGTTALRNADCLNEIELNRRLAPSVYLGLAPLFWGDGGIRIGPVGESIETDDTEHLVVMRRLPSGRDALSLVRAGRLTPDHLEAVADRLSRFHAEVGLGRPAPWTAEEWIDRIGGPVFACFPAIRDSKRIPEVRIRSLEARAREWIGRHRDRFETRRLSGKAVDGHGDLHLDHIWFEDDAQPPLIIDCVEFNADLRRIDRASEIAFAAMDLRYHETPVLAEILLATYAAHADDHGLFAVVDFYTAYRALVRAKVAALTARDPAIEAAQRARAGTSVERHFALAEERMAPPAHPGLILMCGTVGSGKSTIARRLARAGRGIPISSDRVRKAMAGLPPTARVATGPDEGLYRPEQRERVYEGLLERAAPVVVSGRVAILDASFARRADRDRARAWAGQRGIPVRLVEVRCDPDRAQARLRARQEKGSDPSDAGPDFLPLSQARFEAPDEWPEEDREIVWSEDDEPGEDLLSGHTRGGSPIAVSNT